MMKKLFLAVLCGVMLTGCGVAFKQNAAEFIKTQPASVWGEAPSQELVQALQNKALKTILKDFDAARIEQGAIQRIVISKTMTNPEPLPVWQSEVMVNGKNSYGGYTGFKKYYFYFYLGKMYAIEPEGEVRLYL
jgi:shikimate kinase